MAARGAVSAVATVAVAAAAGLLGLPRISAAFGLESSGQPEPLRFIHPTDCTTLTSDSGLSVNVSIAHGLKRGECVVVHVRHSQDKVWWFLTPPTPLKDTQYRFCVNADLQLTGVVPLTPGYARLTAWWEQTRSSKERSPGHATVFVSVRRPGEEHGDLLKLARQGQEERDGHLLEDTRKNQELSAKYRLLAKHPWLQGATAKTAGLLDPRLVSALKDGTPRALWKVVEDAEEPLLCEQSPAQTCQDCKSYQQSPVSFSDRRLPWRDEEPIPPVVYRVPIFTPEAAEMLLQELQAANGSPMAGELTTPQNPDGYGRKPGSPPGAVMLSEVGLGPLVESLVKDVLGPITRLVYPQWGGESIDSWQGFSLHRSIPNEEEQRRLVWEHASKADETRLRSDFLQLGRNSSEVDAIFASGGAREVLVQLATRTFKEKGWIGTDVDGHFRKICNGEDKGHTDICELTVNICLGRNFSRNGVFFGGYSGMHGLSRPPMWVPHVPGSAYISVCQHMHNSVGPASGERHSVVIRAMSSQIRAAPAESFAKRCMA